MRKAEIFRSFAINLAYAVTWQAGQSLPVRATENLPTMPASAPMLSMDMTVNVTREGSGSLYGPGHAGVGVVCLFPIVAA